MVVSWKKCSHTLIHKWVGIDGNGKVNRCCTRPLGNGTCYHGSRLSCCHGLRDSLNRHSDQLIISPSVSRVC